MSQRTVPFLDLSRNHQRLRTRILEGWAQVYGQGAFVGGPVVADFEKGFASFCGTEHALGVANGTDALVVGLRALGVGPGDKVVVPALSFIASAAAVRLVGAEPLFVDVGGDLCLDPVKLFHLDDTSIKAVMPVHLYGQGAPMVEIMKVCRARGWKVIEDAAQAHGASVDGRRVGSWGDLAAFSFYPTKNLGAMGDAGAITTSDRALFDRCKEIANHGRSTHHRHERLGFNSRLDALQAVVLSAKLESLEDDNDIRAMTAARYRAAFADLPGLRLPLSRSDAKHVYHQFIVMVQDRDAFRRALTDQGVGSAIYYPAALVDESAVCEAPPMGDFENARQLAAMGVALPIFPELENAEIQQVIDAVRAAVTGR